MHPVERVERFSPMDEKTRMPRTVETPEEREERLQREAKMKRANAAAEDKEMDAMVKRSIERHGP